MSPTSEIEFLDQAIATQQSAMRVYVGLSVGAIMVAPVVAFIPDHLGSVDVPAVAKLLGGLLTASASGFPLREIYTRRDTIAALRFLRSQFEQCRAGAGDGAEVVKLQQRLWQLVDKKLGG
jgi:hypothetical protein